jgi:hypothetical protein
VIAGKSLAKLREILGHSTLVVTERYAHLAPSMFRDDDLMMFAHDLMAKGAEVIDLAAAREDRCERGGEVAEPQQLMTTLPMGLPQNA